MPPDKLLRPGGCLVLVVGVPAGLAATPEDFGPLVAAASAGLGYLQHIVAVAARADGDHFEIVTRLPSAPHDMLGWAAALAEPDRLILAAAALRAGADHPGSATLRRLLNAPKRASAARDLRRTLRRLRNTWLLAPVTDNPHITKMIAAELTAALGSLGRSPDNLCGDGISSLRGQTVTGIGDRTLVQFDAAFRLGFDDQCFAVGVDLCPEHIVSPHRPLLMVTVDEPTRADHPPAFFVQVCRRQNLAHVPGTSGGCDRRQVAEELGHGGFAHPLRKPRECRGFGVRGGERGHAGGVVERLDQAGVVATRGYRHSGTSTYLDRALPRPLRDAAFD
ncbi:hypothetical protein [Phytohabitans kaempferiae]|uniref:Uncharacterized protein n=1 Tax=Phytohabitans kaempferiae TaxID=1620943 RepID=A0ABV6LW33_9ACTN